MKAPQILVIIIWVITLMVTLIKDGESKGNYSIPETIIILLLDFGLLYWGGFFG